MKLTIVNQEKLKNSYTVSLFVNQKKVTLKSNNSKDLSKWKCKNFQFLNNSLFCGVAFNLKQAIWIRQFRWWIFPSFQSWWDPATTPWCVRPSQWSTSTTLPLPKNWQTICSTSTTTTRPTSPTSNGRITSGEMFWLLLLLTNCCINETLFFLNGQCLMHALTE